MYRSENSAQLPQNLFYVGELKFRKSDDSRRARPPPIDETRQR